MHLGQHIGQHLGQHFGQISSTTPVVIAVGVILNADISDVSLTSDEIFFMLPADLSDASLVADVVSQGGIRGVPPRILVPRPRMDCCDPERQEPCIEVCDPQLDTELCLQLLKDEPCPC